MNETLQVIMQRKSVRVYEEREIEPEARAQIFAAAMRAPTAGNLMLYSIIEVADQAAKDTLAKSCDNQPFIAKAPLVLLFLADYQRWFDYFIVSGVPELCRQKGVPMRRPEEGDLFLACCDALIAAQTAVIAAESLGIGSCYIGDIMEQYEIHKKLFDLPQYTFPICLLCFGYPTEQQKNRGQTSRLAKEFVVFENRYRRLTPGDCGEMYRERQAQAARAQATGEEAPNFGQQMYLRKFNADFAVEMNRSVREILKVWKGTEG